LIFVNQLFAQNPPPKKRYGYFGYEKTLDFVWILMIKEMKFF